MGGERITPGGSRFEFSDPAAFQRATTALPRFLERLDVVDYNHDGVNELIASTQAGELGQKIVVVDLAQVYAAEQKHMQRAEENLTAARTNVEDLERVIESGMAGEPAVVDAQAKISGARMTLTTVETRFNHLANTPSLTTQVEDIGKQGTATALDP